MMAWLPTLLNERFGLDAKQLSVACLPYIALGVGKWVGGKSEYIAAEWFGVTGQLKQRKAIGVSGCVGGAVFVLFALWAPTWQLAIFFFCAERVVETAGALGGFTVNKLEVVAPRYVGALEAWTNTLAAASGMLAVRMAAVLVEMTGGWDAVFVMIASVYLIAAVSYQRMASCTPIARLS